MELLTIADFAEKAEVTVQAVYSRLKKDLAPYLIEENGIKYLKQDALSLFKSNQRLKENQKIKALQTKVEELETLVESLTADKLALTEKLAANNDTLLKILSQQTQQQENYQLLIAQVQTSLTKLLPSVEEPNSTFNEDELNLKQEVKPNIFKRIFKRS